MYFVRVGALSNQKVLSNPKLVREEKAEIRRREKRARLNKKREACIKEENLDYTGQALPIRIYLILANIADAIVRSVAFDVVFFAVVVLAGIVVGLETYPSFDNSTTTNSINTFVLVMFVLEIVFRVVKEGKQPMLYFTGKDWRWNVFDLLIVVLGALPINAQQILVLRVIRLLRVAKLVRRITQYKMILMGLLGGLEAVVYILILLLINFYLFGIGGIIFFSKNDPFHFHTMEVAMITLFRVATFDNWGEVFYINYLGCDRYKTELYTTDPNKAGTGFGDMLLCHPEPRPWLSSAYFLAFITTASFCVFSFFIAAITLAMAESLQSLQIEKDIQRLELNKLKINRMVVSLRKEAATDNVLRRKLRLVAMAFTGREIRVEDLIHLEHNWRYLSSWYALLAHYAQRVVDHLYFQNFITATILLGAILVGLGTAEAYHDKRRFDVANLFIQYIFLFEALIKIVAHEFFPWRYFNDYWNLFDVMVVILSFVPFGANGSVVFVRILRLLRVLRFMHVLPTLQVVSDTLLKVFHSISIISVLLFMFYYFYAVIGVVIFASTDPFHFGSLPVALLTLFQASTLDNWSSVMYLSLYGCSVSTLDDVSNGPVSCGNHSAKYYFVVGCFYWISFVLISSFILVSLFIGLVNLSMEQSKFEQDKQAALTKRVQSVQEKLKLELRTVYIYREVFEVIDYSNAGKIGKDELELGMKIAGVNVYAEEIKQLWRNNIHVVRMGLNFDEFLEFMVKLKETLNQPMVSVDTSSLNRNRIRQSLFVVPSARDIYEGSDDDDGEIKENEEKPIASPPLCDTTSSTDSRGSRLDNNPRQLPSAQNENLGAPQTAFDLLLYSPVEELQKEWKSVLDLSSSFGFRVLFGGFAYFFTGTIFYAYNGANSWRVGFATAVSVAMFIGWEYRWEFDESSVAFSLLFHLIAHLFVALLLAYFAKYVVKKEQAWFDTITRREEFDRSLKNLKGWNKIRTWIIFNVHDVTPFVAWFAMIVIGAAWSATQVKWSFMSSVYFAVSTCMASGLWELPTSRPPHAYGFLGFYALIGISITGLVLAKIASFFIYPLNPTKCAEIVKSHSTVRDIKRFEEAKIQADVGYVTKAEFILLSVLKLDLAKPDFVRYLGKYFEKLDVNKTGSLSSRELLCLDEFVKSEELPQGLKEYIRKIEAGMRHKNASEKLPSLDEELTEAHQRSLKMHNSPFS